jgi:hypothetical protein
MYCLFQLAILSTVAKRLTLATATEFSFTSKAMASAGGLLSGATSKTNIAYHLFRLRFNTSVDASSASLRRTFHQYSQNLLCGFIQTSLLPPGSDTAILTGAAEAAVFR